MEKLVLVTHGISVLVRDFRHISVVYIFLTRGKSTNYLDIILSSFKLKYVFLFFLSDFTGRERKTGAKTPGPGV